MKRTLVFITIECSDNYFKKIIHCTFTAWLLLKMLKNMSGWSIFLME